MSTMEELNPGLKGRGTYEYGYAFKLNRLIELQMEGAVG